jgi:la-related protein 1
MLFTELKTQNIDCSVNTSYCRKLIGFHWENDYRSEAEDSEDELSDSEIDKIVIVTQRKRSDSVTVTANSTSSPPNLSNRPLKHEGYDRTGNWTTRTKMTQELAKVINDGLRYFEEDNRTEVDSHHTLSKSGSFTTVNVISKEDFEKLAPQIPRAINPEFPPPPPVPCNTPMNPSYLQDQPSQTETGNADSSRTKPRSKNRTRRRSARFYPVDESSESKEHHVGWIRDGKRRRTRTMSIK